MLLQDLLYKGDSFDINFCSLLDFTGRLIHRGFFLEFFWLGLNEFLHALFLIWRLIGGWLWLADTLVLLLGRFELEFLDLKLFSSGFFCFDFWSGYGSGFLDWDFLGNLFGNLFNWGFLLWNFDCGLDWCLFLKNLD
jgi:hypothetical protein